MQNCQICGRSFDPLGFQVVVPELGRGFDRIDCARSARALAGPGGRIAAVPLIALAAPVAVPAAVAATAAAPRVLGSTAATLGVLAAGTAAAVLLWMRVVGTDTTSYTLGRLTAPPAFGHETVHAQIAPAPEAGRATGTPAAAPVEKLVVLASPTIPAPGGAGRAGPQRPSTSAVPARAAKPLSGPGKATGKGHPKHGRGHQKQKTKTHGHHAGGQGQVNGAASTQGQGQSGRAGGKSKNKH